MGCWAGRYISLWTNPLQEGALEAQEREAARTMCPYGGRIERAICSVGQVGDAPVKVQLVSFPAPARTDSGASDPETANLASRRSEIIVRTSGLEGRQAGRCQVDLSKTLG